MRPSGRTRPLKLVRLDGPPAATVEVLGAELPTLDVKHFPMFPGLEPAFP